MFSSGWERDIQDQFSAFSHKDHFGLAKEFKEFPDYVNALRHYLGLNLSNEL